jgi:hypothetical protein
MPFGEVPFSQERRQFMEEFGSLVRAAILDAGAEVGGTGHSGETYGPGKFESMQWESRHYARGAMCGVVHIVMLGAEDDTVTLFFDIHEVQAAVELRP